jgi:hypothetical protein
MELFLVWKQSLNKAFGVSRTDRSIWLFFFRLGSLQGRRGFMHSMMESLLLKKTIACYHGRHETLPALQPSTRLFWWLVFGGYQNAAVTGQK